MRKLVTDERIVSVVMSLYENVRSHVRINGSFSEEFEVKFGVHQGSVLSPLLFIMVSGCLWELLYADDLVLISESMEELIEKFNTWKEGIDAKGLKVNIVRQKWWSLELALYHLLPQVNGHAQYVENALVVTQYFVICVQIRCIKQGPHDQAKPRKSNECQQKSGIVHVFSLESGNVREIFNIYLFHVSGMQDLALQNLVLSEIKLNMYVNPCQF